MAKPWDQYTKELNQKFGYLATWAPDVNLKLGDVGVLKDNLFTRLTSLQKLGIDFEQRADDTPSDIKYSSANNVSITFKAAGQIPIAGSALKQAEAGVSIEFKKSKSVVFEAAGCRTPSIEDQLSLGQEIINRYKQGKWNKDWVVITELVTADSGTVIIAAQSSSKIELSASGSVTAAAFSLADVNAGLTIMSSKDIQTSIIAKAGMTPLFRARGVKNSGTVPISLTSNNLHAMHLVAPDDPSAQFYFGNIGYDYTNFDQEAETVTA